MTASLEHVLALPLHPAIAALTAAELGAVLLSPDRVGVPSSWWGHVPFAHWLVHELKPCLLVELGTHYGVSFSAFCNAVRQYGLATRCYAVDTWQGDEHAGFYDESVFNGISASVRQNYASFATLVRSSFDAAIGQFAENSIDLLHIDGLHTYEAVKADFEAWWPKLSDRGVVLFHDIAIHERGFGVWRFWREISQRHPSFEFHHSCGLGVLAPGGVVPDFIQALIAMESAVGTVLRQRLAALGDRWIQADERARDSVTIRALTEYQHGMQTENARLRQQLDLQSEATHSTHMIASGTGAADMAGAWTQTTGVVSATSGTITAAAANLRYKKVGRTVLISVVVPVIINGSGSGALLIALPFTAGPGTYVLNGRETSAGKVLAGSIASNSGELAIMYYDGSYPGSNGANLTLSGIYEAAA